MHIENLGSYFSAIPIPSKNPKDPAPQTILIFNRHFYYLFDTIWTFFRVKKRKSVRDNLQTNS
jgi:hypothetical protein